MKRLVLLAAILSAFGCQSPPKKGTFDGVGLWEEKGPNVEAVTLRNADGTMKRKEIRRFDYSKDPARFDSQWRWSIRGDDYRITLLEMSGEAWEKDIGKTWNLKVLSLNENVFGYLSSDGAVVEEKRVGSASNDAFNEARLTGL
jgi:hypothetical protein